MKVKVTRNTVIEGSVWFAGDVANVSDDEAKAAIRRGDAVPADETPDAQKKTK